MKLLILILMLSGCSYFAPNEIPAVDKVIYIALPLSLPMRPELPTWSKKDMMCLDVSIMQKISERDTLRREYAEKLEVIIKSTQK